MKNENCQVGTAPNAVCRRGRGGGCAWSRREQGEEQGLLSLQGTFVLLAVPAWEPEGALKAAPEPVLQVKDVQRQGEGMESVRASPRNGSESATFRQF